MPPAIPRGLQPGDEIDYVERTTALTVSATTAAGANTFITGNAVIYDGATRVKIEAFCPLGTGSTFLSVDIWEDSTDIGIIAQVNAPANTTIIPVYGCMFRTPAAGSHTYTVRAWRGSSGELDPQGGGAATRVPAFLRITKA